MAFVPTNPKTGQFALIQQIMGASTAVAADPCSGAATLPNAMGTYATGYLFRVSDRTHKIPDPDVIQNAVLYNNAVKITQPWFHLGGGYIWIPGGITPAGMTAEAGTITITGSPVTTFTFLDGSSSAPLAMTGATTNAQVQTHLQGLATIGAGNITVSGSAGGPFTYAFAAALGSGRQSTLTVPWLSATVAGSGTVVIAQTVAGVAAVTMDFSYLSTTGAADIRNVPECKDFKLTDTAATVKDPVYGLITNRTFTSFSDGGFSFMQNAVDQTFKTYQRQGKTVNLLVYMSTLDALPLVLSVGGKITATPMDFTMSGMESGTLTADYLPPGPIILHEAV